MKNCPRWHASVGVVVGSNVGKELGTRVGLGVVVAAEVLGAGEGLKT